jgi:hypothetical protein
MFKESHPRVMADFIRKMNWQIKLNYTQDQRPARPLMKHEKRKYRILSWIENKLAGGREIFGYTNWKLKNKWL